MLDQPGAGYPASFASDRIAFDEPTTWSGRGCAANRSATGASTDAACARRASIASGARRIVGEEADRHAPRTERHRFGGIRQLFGARRDLERPAADVEQQDLAGRPPEPAADGQEREPRLGLAAEHLQALAERGLDARDHLRAVRSLAHRGRRRCEQLVDALGCRHPTGFAHRLLQGADAVLGDRAVGREVAHEAQHGALARGRERPPSRPHIGDEQVDGVRADVEDSEAHA